MQPYWRAFNHTGRLYSLFSCYRIDVNYREYEVFLYACVVVYRSCWLILSLYRLRYCYYPAVCCAADFFSVSASLTAEYSWTVYYQLRIQYTATSDIIDMQEQHFGFNFSIACRTRSGEKEVPVWNLVPFTTPPLLPFPFSYSSPHPFPFLHPFHLFHFHWCVFPVPRSPPSDPVRESEIALWASPAGPADRVRPTNGFWCISELKMTLPW